MDGRWTWDMVAQALARKMGDAAGLEDLIQAEAERGVRDLEDWLHRLEGPVDVPD